MLLTAFARAEYCVMSVCLSVSRSISITFSTHVVYMTVARSVQI